MRHSQRRCEERRLDKGKENGLAGVYNLTSLTQVHNLSGPIAVEGAEPGDCLVVDILDVTPFEKMPWGYTVRGLLCGSDNGLTDGVQGIFELNNGGGLFAREFNSKAAKAIWDFHGNAAFVGEYSMLKPPRDLRILASHPGRTLRRRLASRSNRYRTVR